MKRGTLGLLFGLTFLAAAGSSPVRAEIAVDLELVLAIDVSGSIDSTEAFLQREGYIQALTSPEVVRAATAGPLGRIAVSYVEWAGSRHVRTVVDWQLIDGPEAAQRVADMVFDADLFPGQRTAISNAILYALPLFRDNGFAGTRRVIDISGDGPNNDGLPVLVAREAAAAAGVSVNGLAILNDRVGPYGYPTLQDLDVYYEECVIVGQGAFVLVADGFSDFSRAIRRKLVLEIAGLTPRRAGLQSVSGYDCLIGERQLRQWLERAPFDP